MSSTLDWANLFEEEAPRLMRFLRRFGPRISAEDISQDAFAKLCAANREEIANPQAYLIATARNLALNELRRKGIEPTRAVPDIELLSHPTADLSPEDAVIAEESAARVRAALGAIAAKHRTALILFRIERLTHKEIGQLMGVSHRTVERYIADAVRQCHEILSADEPR